MITSTQLIELNWPKGKAFGNALELASQMAATGAEDEQILAALKDVQTNPEAYDTEGNLFRELATVFIALKKREEVPEVRDEPLDAPIWGEHLIDKGALDQLRNAMRLRSIRSRCVRTSRKSTPMIW